MKADDSRMLGWWCVAGALVVGGCYVAGLPSIGGALLLSGLLVGIVNVVRSGVLAADWLQRVPLRSLQAAANVELAKAFVCAGLVVDVFRAGRWVIDPLVPSRTALMIHVSLLVVVMGSLLVGAGAFLMRSFAAWLTASR